MPNPWEKYATEPTTEPLPTAQTLKPWERYAEPAPVEQPQDVDGHALIPRLLYTGPFQIQFLFVIFCS